MQVRDHFATDSNYRSRAAIVTTGNEGETFWQRDILNRYYREFMLRFSQAETLRLQEAEKKRKIHEMQQQRRQRIKVLEREWCYLNDCERLELQKDEERCRATNRSGAPSFNQPGYEHMHNSQFVERYDDERPGDTSWGQPAIPPCIDLDRDDDAKWKHSDDITTTHTISEKRHYRATIHNIHKSESFTNTNNAITHTNTALEDTFIEAHHRLWLRPDGLKDVPIGVGTAIERQKLIVKPDAEKPSESGVHSEPCLASSLDKDIQRLRLKPRHEKLRLWKRRLKEETTSGGGSNCVPRSTAKDNSITQSKGIVPFVMVLGVILFRRQFHGTTTVVWWYVRLKQTLFLISVVMDNKRSMGYLYQITGAFHGPN
uniref:uncharacterized protein LOC125906887 n=1 Tax=Anopheles coluzzii TaxID=1518534 RepID=UPI0020FFD541|nr:uncharacterized protein LOC125906887 [Anopheles coluzzii]